ncbi:MAG TPA: glycogen debranching N-terminal domain-containing protein, partial [Vicinamibacterales bacterium]|nr:glycogen debranching N-terminal domain-containing protein [Vicinamibacterales bacterium]
MTTQARHGDALTADEKRQREDILTQDAPSKQGTTAGATILKHGDVYLLADDAGDVPWDLPHVCGLFTQDCRFLNGLLLRIEGERPTALSTSHIGEQHSAHVLTNAGSLPQQNGDAVAENAIAIRRSREMRHGVLYEHIRFANHDSRPAVLRASIRARCEFEDVFVVKGFTESSRGALSPPRATGDRTLEWSYRGRDQQLRRTILTFDPAPDEIRDDEVHFVVKLAPGEHASVALTITAVVGEAPTRVCRPDAGAEDPGRHRRRAEERWLGSATRLRSSDELFDRVLHRALLDLRLLRSRLGRFHYFAGGVPWFVTLFGRDSMLAAMQTLAYGPAVARDTLLLMAQYQADRDDEYRDAEPGKILHELRRGELAHLGEIPQSPVYYGTVDATMLFLILAAEYLAWSGDLETIQRIRPNIDAALRWMATCGDHDEDGYFDYVGQYDNGLVNQAWKDSGQAIVNADGSLAEPPIATAEVQSYAYLAWRQSAVVLRALGAAREAGDADRRADGLRTRFAGDFWSDDL